MPNPPVLDQFILRVERTPDTVQTDHNDWGFRVTNLYGTDYRFTAEDDFSTSFKSEMRSTGTPSRCTSMIISPDRQKRSPASGRPLYIAMRHRGTAFSRKLPLQPQPMYSVDPYT